MSSPSTKPQIFEFGRLSFAQQASGFAHLFESFYFLHTDIEETDGRALNTEQKPRHGRAHDGEVGEMLGIGPIDAPTSRTIDSPRSVGHRAAIAGRSIPGKVFNANFDIAMNAPVFPAETAMSASRFLTASIASHIDDLRRPISQGLARFVVHAHREFGVRNP